MKEISPMSSPLQSVLKAHAKSNFPYMAVH